MPVFFRILPERGLLYVRFEGDLTVDEATQAYAEYTRHPDMRPGQKQLLDMERVTGSTPDFTALMELHARQLDVLLSAKHEILYVYYAPAGPAQALARLAIRSWDEVPGVVALLQQTEADTLHVLGQPETAIHTMLQAA